MVGYPWRLLGCCAAIPATGSRLHQRRSIERALLASTTGLSTQATEASNDLVSQFLNWQDWSALLATLSSVVVVLTGFITRLSGWMIAIRRNVRIG